MEHPGERSDRVGVSRASDRLGAAPRAFRKDSDMTHLGQSTLTAAAGLLALVVLVGAVVAATAPSAAAQATTPGAPSATAGDESMRPFRVHFPDEALADLKRRVLATRWPEREIVTDASQGVQLATIQKLARYWASDYDWRKCEARLNALPQFM